jgi:hypothetical protein
MFWTGIRTEYSSSARSGVLHFFEEYRKQNDDANQESIALTQSEDTADICGTIMEV